MFPRSLRDCDRMQGATMSANADGQGSKPAKAGGAEKRGRNSIDIKCLISGLHLHVNILNFWLICNRDALLKAFPFVCCRNSANFDR